MTIVVSDTSPICYLLLINRIDILPNLYKSIIIPQTVAGELAAPESPSAVKNWIARPPSWLQIQSIELSQDIQVEKLDAGESEAILLAEQLKADLVILDDLAARRIATKRGLKIIGLLGIVKDAAFTCQLVSQRFPWPNSPQRSAIKIRIKANQTQLPSFSYNVLVSIIKIQI